MSFLGKISLKPYRVLKQSIRPRGELLFTVLFSSLKKKINKNKKNCMHNKIWSYTDILSHYLPEHIHISDKIRKLHHNKQRTGLTSEVNLERFPGQQALCGRLNFLRSHH